MHEGTIVSGGTGPARIVLTSSRAMFKLPAAALLAHSRYDLSVSPMPQPRLLTEVSSPSRQCPLTTNDKPNAYITEHPGGRMSDLHSLHVCPAHHVHHQVCDQFNLQEESCSYDTRAECLQVEFDIFLEGQATTRILARSLSFTTKSITSLQTPVQALCRHRAPRGCDHRWTLRLESASRKLALISRDEYGVVRS